MYTAVQDRHTACLVEAESSMAPGWRRPGGLCVRPFILPRIVGPGLAVAGEIDALFHPGIVGEPGVEEGARRTGRGPRLPLAPVHAIHPGDTGFLLRVVVGALAHRHGDDQSVGRIVDTARDAARPAVGPVTELAGGRIER